jgi:hypothetical protein
MIKFIIPAIVILFIVLYWKKIDMIIYKKLGIKLNYLLIISALLIITIIVLLIIN